MSYKRVLTVQDISCIGQCSLTVALPILSVCGHETVVLPSAVLSSHTGGFHGNTFRDLTEDFPDIRKHWCREGIFFDAIYTGYLGSEKQIDYVRELIRTTKKSGAPVIVDPAMADNGKLYSGFTPAYVGHMKQLCVEADYLLPNITEACLLTGMDYRADFGEGAGDPGVESVFDGTSVDQIYIKDLLDALSKQFPKATVILTGIGFHKGETGVFICKGNEKQYYAHRKIAGSCHGTGDIFASAFTGTLLRGMSPLEAASVAADFVTECIRETAGDENHWYGAKFEPALPKLVKRIYDI